ncbi:unnamed protein product [Symbiodinium necroappetens]|uniref:Uncharacterized protein n=1 Tax=Symbiodinium necroappetens TaxID=1628268 RepID=A0A812SRK1_9DINO|nr:unnamed protein product [Symbiodinium necroappetens]
MAKWQLGEPGVFSLTGCHIGACQPSQPRAAGRFSRPRLEKSPSLASKNRRARAQIEQSVFSQWQPVEIAAEEAAPTNSGLALQSAQGDAEEDDEEDEETIKRLLDWRREPDEKEAPRGKMTLTSSNDISARMRWQVAFAKVREKTGVARRNQHRIALTNKVKEYLMYTNSRGSCSKLVRSLESYDRSTWMEREEISYKRFTEGLLDEAETWVTKNFEDMQSALEPVVLSEPKRQYDMNEFERMLRMNEQENEWLDAQRRKTDELMDVHVRLVSRSTASMADSIARVKQALTSLVNEIAEGLRRHNKLVKEHEATEAELYDLARKQKLLQTALEEFEVRKKEATDRYARELETLKTEYGKLKRAVETAQSALVKDTERYNQFWRNLLASLKSKISDQLDVLGQAHIQRIRRQREVHERQGIMRRSTLEKEIQELRRLLKERRTYLKEARIRQELTDLRQELYEARLLLFELNARAGEVSETGDPAEGEVLRKLWKTGDATKMPESGLLPLLVQQLQIQRQWLLDRGQGFSLSLRRLLPKGSA